MVTGSERLPTLNSELLTEAAVTVTLDPVALIVTGIVLLDPTLTLPKLKVLGLTENPPDAVPLPLKVIEELGVAAVETSEMLPLEDPLAVGVKVTLKVKF